MEFLLTTSENDTCFDCGEYGPDHVNLTALTFICLSCAKLLSHNSSQHSTTSDANQKPKHLFGGVALTILSPSSPHHTAPTTGKFTLAELSLLRFGNTFARTIWLSTHTLSDTESPLFYALPERDDGDAVRRFMDIKYRERRWYASDIMDAHRDANRREFGNRTDVNDAPESEKPMTSGTTTPDNREEASYSVEEVDERIDCKSNTKSYSIQNSKLPSPPIEGATSWFGFAAKTKQPDSKHVANPKPQLKKIDTTLGDKEGAVKEVNGGGWVGGEINTSPTKKKSQYSLSAWSNYFSQPTGYSTVESKRSNMF